MGTWCRVLENGYEEFSVCEGGEMRMAMCMRIGEGWVH